MIICFSLAAFKILSLPLTVNSLIMVCLGVDLFEFILLGFHWASWIFNLMLFIKFVKFSAIISSNILSFHFYLSFTFETPIMYMLICMMVSHSSLRLCSFFSIIVFFFCSLDLRNSIDLYSNYLFFPYASSNLMLSSSSEFFISVLHFSTPEFRFFK